MSIKTACVWFALILLPLLQSCAHDFGHISTPVSATPTKTKANAPAPLSAEQNAKSWWRTEQTLFAGPNINSRGAAIFQYSRLHVQNTDIRIVLVDAVSANISLSCDGAFTLIAPGKTSAADARGTASQDLAGDDAGRTNAKIILSDEVSTCRATFTFPNSRRVIKMVADGPRHAAAANNDERAPSCVPPVPHPRDGLLNALFAPGKLSRTCPFPIGRPELLKFERQAFNAKVKALLGQDLSDEFLNNANPAAQLDLSKAPALSLIYVSTLDYKADFSGMVIVRLLRYHAARGTAIRIMTSKVLERRKDWQILERLASDYPNVALQFYRFKPGSPLNLKEEIASVHRVHHIKLFIAISPTSGQSVAILGGRNIHDGFLYDAPADLSSFPSLQHYGGKRSLTLNYYSNWHDFDIAIHDGPTVKLLASHFSTIWFHGTLAGQKDKFSVKNLAGNGAREGLALHFISIPGEDNRALESYFVGLIDAARFEIEIVNPYLHPTPAIGDALNRAIARGVKIEIIGRVDMRGDLGGEVLTAVNAKFVQANRSRMTIFDYKPADVVLHAKILMIDERLTVISSVNLDNRSFIHDTENGVAILDKAFYDRMKGILDYYKSDSIPVSEKRSWSALQLLLLSKTLREAL